MLTTPQLAKLLQMPYRRAYRVAHLLQFTMSRTKNKLLYHFDKSHPLSLSINLLEGSAKPLYSIKEIAQLWKWRNGHYSKERVRQLLDQYDIPIYNKKNKGLVYLFDLQKLLKS